MPWARSFCPFRACCSKLASALSGRIGCDLWHTLLIFYGELEELNSCYYFLAFIAFLAAATALLYLAVADFKALALLAFLAAATAS